MSAQSVAATAAEKQGSYTSMSGQVSHGGLGKGSVQNSLGDQRRTEPQRVMLQIEYAAIRSISLLMVYVIFGMVSAKFCITQAVEVKNKIDM